MRNTQGDSAGSGKTTKNLAISELQVIDEFLHTTPKPVPGSDKPVDSENADRAEYSPVKPFGAAEFPLPLLAHKIYAVGPAAPNPYQ
jgi:hypothetical protein